MKGRGCASGITCGIEAAAPMDVLVLRPAPWYSIPSIASRCSAWMEKTLRIGIGDDPVVGDLLVGMVLGVTSSIPDALQQGFPEHRDISFVFRERPTCRDDRALSLGDR